MIVAHRRPNSIFLMAQRKEMSAVAAIRLGMAVQSRFNHVYSIEKMLN
jgi:hypothetical protein